MEVLGLLGHVRGASQGGYGPLMEFRLDGKAVIRTDFARILWEGEDDAE